MRRPTEELPLPRAELAARIAARIEIDLTTGCWVWTLRPSRWGYPVLGAGGSTYRAHRLSYEIWVAPLPEGQDVHHRCEQKMCVNPDHLVALSRSEHRREHPLAGFALENSRKATCKAGHSFDGHDGHQRTCSVCARRRVTEFKERQRA